MSDQEPEVNPEEGGAVETPPTPVQDPDHPDFDPDEAAVDNPDESGDDATGDEDAGDGAGGEASPDEEPPATAPPDTSAVLERVSTALYKAAKSYGKRVGDILADDSLGIVPCPLCNDDFPGLLTPAPRSEAAVAAVRPIIGLPDLSTFVEDRFARQCERCQGRGKTLTGSRVPEYATIRCQQCNGTGFTSAEQGFVLQNGSTTTTTVPTPTHEDDSAPFQLPPEAQDALEKMLNASRNVGIGA